MDRFPAPRSGRTRRIGALEALASLCAVLACLLRFDTPAAQAEGPLPWIPVPAPLEAGSFSDDFPLQVHDPYGDRPASWDAPQAVYVGNHPQDFRTEPLPGTGTPHWHAPPPGPAGGHAHYDQQPAWETPSYSTAIHHPQYPPPRDDSGRREGIFQRFTFHQTWLAGRGISDFGMAGSEFGLTLAFPFPSREMPLILTPALGIHFLDGPRATDLPPRLFDADLKIRTMTKLNENWGIDLAVTPGWHSDGRAGGSDAVRISGHAVAAWDSSPRMQWLFGLMYLDRRDVRLLPVAGLIAKPRDDTRLELVFPRPRYAVRIWNSFHGEAWWYLAGEFGGGTWAIERAGGGEDLATLSDYRLIVGWEHQRFGGAKSLFEIGYVFGRRIEYAGPTPDYRPDDTLMLRAGFIF